MLFTAGFLVASYLSWLHHQVYTNPSFHSFCAMSDEFNCETVAESPYSVFLGLPVAVWGLSGYLFMLFLTVVGIGRLKLRAAFVTLLVASCLSVTVSIALAVLSYCVICSFCIMCTVTYVINTAVLVILLFYAFRLRLPLKSALIDPFTIVAHYRKTASALVIVPFLLVVLYPRYWTAAGAVEDKRLQKGTTDDGYYWIGANDPSLIIVEFSDYLCPHCRRAHEFQRRLLASNARKLKLIHRHFPLDDACNPLLKNPFHPGACLLARAANCAGKQDKFWEMNDELYHAETLTGISWEAKLDDAARRIGLNVKSFRQCVSAADTHEEVQDDVAQGLKLNLRGTPSYLVGGKVYVGMIDPSIFEQHGIPKLPE